MSKKKINQRINRTSKEQIRKIQETLPYDLKVMRVKGVGRPSTYKPDYCHMLISHMADGYDFESFAALLNYTSRSVLYQWLHEHKEFREAKNVGESLSHYWWMKLGRAAATGQVPNFNATAWIFSMKNMFGWRDKHDIKAQHTEIKEIIHTVEIGNDGDISQIQKVIKEGE